MKTTQLTIIRERAASVPADLRAVAHSYGVPCVMISCRTAKEAELVAAFVRSARSDIAALLAEVGDLIEPAQAVMEF